MGSAMTGPGGAPVASRWPRKLALGLLVAAGLLASVELIARAASGQWTPVHEPASRGFDPAEAYIVQASPPSAGLTTHIFDGGEHEVKIPPKDGRQRVLLFGG